MQPASAFCCDRHLDGFTCLSTQGCVLGALTLPCNHGCAGHASCVVLCAGCALVPTFGVLVQAEQVYLVQMFCGALVRQAGLVANAHAGRVDMYMRGRLMCACRVGGCVYVCLCSVPRYSLCGRCP